MRRSRIPLLGLPLYMWVPFECAGHIQNLASGFNRAGQLTLGSLLGIFYEEDKNVVQEDTK